MLFCFFVSALKPNIHSILGFGWVDVQAAYFLHFFQLVVGVGGLRPKENINDAAVFSA
jgi:hypothetical protein